MDILLVSEGSHEGHPDDNKPQSLQTIVSRILPRPAIFTWKNVRDISRTTRLRGTGGGHFKLALRWMQHAAREGFDALVLLTDADRDRDRITQFNDAQITTQFQIPRALGIAVEEFDAWILADQKALSKVIGQSVPLQKDPEAMRDPKSICQQVIETSGWNGTQAEFYEGVCGCMDLDTVCNRCSKGFAPFVERVKRLPT